MNSMGVRAVLAVLLLCIATVKAENGEVTFWRENFTMTCPDSGTWFDKDNNELPYFSPMPRKSVTFKYDNSKKGPYHCKYGDDASQKKYYFYVQGKVCENCFELEASLCVMAIVADVVGTAFVMMIIYRCTKKKSPAGLTPASKPPARSGGRAPAVPSPDYDVATEPSHPLPGYLL
ncbi:T-cell surface glycoprotein CD3 epsilon chain-like isoform X2 [Siniperca chuatsi]|uniref:T-cell surface glycoprotein CD3 epsilon chain-like isoform X2 n=1 Tax=Siniperca chuatsi TaxID=119488 RepID=UPI001CE0CAC6|nr:T-cell surface glycoprotein CD3 epsilon chain-like isoform X2 [Siniperca chuatsi]